MRTAFHIIICYLVFIVEERQLCFVFKCEVLLHDHWHVGGGSVCGMYNCEVTLNLNNSNGQMGNCNNAQWPLKHPNYDEVSTQKLTLKRAWQRAENYIIHKTISSHLQWMLIPKTTWKRKHINKPKK